MNRFLDTLTDWIAITFLLLTLALSWLADHYRNQLRHKADELQQLQALVTAQNQHAQTELQRLTAERDAAQAKADTQHQQQEKADAQAQQEIARLNSELERGGPVRVRIVHAPQPATCGPGGGGAPGHPAASADPGAADAAQAYGLLPERNSRRLGAVIAEAETINAAYASCRARLLKQEGAHS